MDTLFLGYLLLAPISRTLPLISLSYAQYLSYHLLLPPGYKLERI